jgi:DNA helicase-2/ATP-dependent DNA helicase PcrA
MTAFKSKGMEFGAVFVLATSDEAWGTKARGQSARLSLPQNLQFIRYAGATNDERLRLFYVAVTRAKTQLYLVNYQSNFAGKHLNRLSYLSESLEDGEVVSPLLPKSAQQVLPAESVAQTSPAEELGLFWQHRHEAALRRTDAKDLLGERIKQFQLSPTHVNSFIDLVHCGPTQFFMDTILRFPQAPTANIQFGNSIHETLEWLHIQNKMRGSLPSLDTTLKEFERRLRTKRLSTRETEEMLARGQAALTAYMQQRLHTISSDNETEYNFRREGVFVGDAHMAGKIDKLIIDREHKTLTIVDFKTGKSYHRWEHDTKLHKYRQQLYLYRALVEGSRKFAGYKVTDAYLEFVEPDDDGTIQELHLSMTDAEYDHNRRVAEAVWRSIQKLQLPDVSTYSPDIKGIELFEEQLVSDQPTLL